MLKKADESRSLPCSKDAERSVLGAMILDKGAVSAVSEVLSADDFFYKEFGIIFNAIIDLYNEGADDIDPVILAERVSSFVNFDPKPLIADLIVSVPSSSMAKAYAGVVADKALLRRLIKECSRAIEACYSDPADISGVVESTEKGIFDALQGHSADEAEPIRRTVINVLDRIDKASKSDGCVTGLATGFIEIDYKTAGLQPSNLILVAARPSMGKTAFALKIAHYAAVQNEIPVAFFSLEMSKEELVSRLISMSSCINSEHLRSGKLRDEEWERLVQFASPVGNSALIIDDSPAASDMTVLRSRARRYAAENGVKLIIVDYLQLMGSGSHSDSRQQEVSSISRSFKVLARELNIPIIVLSQLNRAAEKRENKRPMLSDLRESGAIEQDADVVMMLYRDDYYNADSEEPGVAEVIIAKQRNGPVGTTKLQWIKEYTLFANRA